MEDTSPSQVDAARTPCGKRVLCATSDGHLVEVYLPPWRDMQLHLPTLVDFAHDAQHGGAFAGGGASAGDDADERVVTFLGRRRHYVQLDMRRELLDSLVASVRHNRVITCGSCTLEEVTAELAREGLAHEESELAAAAPPSGLDAEPGNATSDDHSALLGGDACPGAIDTVIEDAVDDLLAFSREARRSSPSAGDAADTGRERRLAFRRQPRLTVEAVMRQRLGCQHRLNEYVEQVAESLVTWPTMLHACSYMHDPRGHTGRWFSATEAHIALCESPSVVMPLAQRHTGAATTDAQNRHSLVERLLAQWPTWLNDHTVAFCMLCVSAHIALSKKGQLVEHEVIKRPLASGDASGRPSGSARLRLENALSCVLSERIRDWVFNHMTRNGRRGSLWTTACICQPYSTAKVPGTQTRMYAQTFADLLRHIAMRGDAHGRKPAWVLALLSNLIDDVADAPSPAVVFRGDAEEAAHTRSYARRLLADALARRGLRVLRWEPLSDVTQNVAPNSNGVTGIEPFSTGAVAPFPWAWAQRESFQAGGWVKLVVTWLPADAADAVDQGDGGDCAADDGPPDGARAAKRARDLSM